MNDIIVIYSVLTIVICLYYILFSYLFVDDFDDVYIPVYSKIRKKNKKFKSYNETIKCNCCNIYTRKGYVELHNNSKDNKTCPHCKKNMNAYYKPYKKDEVLPYAPVIPKKEVFNFEKKLKEKEKEVFVSKQKTHYLELQKKLSNEKRLDNIYLCDSLKTFPDNWDKEGGKAFDEQHIENVKIILESISYQPTVTPTQRNSVCLAFSLTPYMLEFEVFESMVKIHMIDSQIENQILPITSDLNVILTSLNQIIIDFYEKYEPKKIA